LGPGAGTIFLFFVVAEVPFERQLCNKGNAGCPPTIKRCRKLLPLVRINPILQIFLKVKFHEHETKKRQQRVDGNDGFNCPTRATVRVHHL
jgi:hypothetical protein